MEVKIVECESEQGRCEQRGVGSWVRPGNESGRTRVAEFFGRHKADCYRNAEWKAPHGIALAQRVKVP